MRPDATELGNARRRVERLLDKLPGDAGDRAFERPWELRAFALAVAAYHAGRYDWSAFQLSLIGAIRHWEEAGARDEEAPWSYYELWLDALETTLSQTGVLTGAELDERTMQVLASPAHSDQRAHPEPVAIDPAR